MAKRKGENELLAKREKLILEIERQTRRMQEFTEYSDLDRMQQVCVRYGRYQGDGALCEEIHRMETMINKL